MATKTYTVKNAKTGETVMTGSLQQFDNWWNKNWHTINKWSVEQDTRASKVFLINV